ncbi:unnamed protein product [Nezara viridula]|uniref:Retrotransposon gag domain-containing protein n=1 Tax=Nezara viridula TaxID=85310 RepID=A0A9P0EDG2_NEZVI|nr:unnamed protein product [Nezara viridula]
MSEKLQVVEGKIEQCMNIIKSTGASVRMELETNNASQESGATSPLMGQSRYFPDIWNIGPLMTKERQISEKCKFSSSKKHIPTEFITRLQLEYDVYGRHMLLEYFIKDHLEDDALAWYSTSQGTMATFEEFKKKFLSRFHGSKYDQLLYEELNCGLYFNKLHLSPTEYFSRLVIRARACQSKPEDAYICKTLGRHFGPKIEEIVIYQGIDNIDRFMQLLEDVGKEKIMKSKESRIAKDSIPSSG